MYYDIPEGLGLRKIATDSKEKPRQIAGSYEKQKRDIMDSYRKDRYNRGLSSSNLGRSNLSLSNLSLSNLADFDYMDERSMIGDHGMALSALAFAPRAERRDGNHPRARRPIQPVNRHADGRWAKLRAEQRRLAAAPKATTMGEFKNLTLRDWVDGVKALPRGLFDGRDATGKVPRSLLSRGVENIGATLKQLPNVTLGEVRAQNRKDTEDTIKRLSGMWQGAKTAWDYATKPSQLLK